LLIATTWTAAPFAVDMLRRDLRERENRGVANVHGFLTRTATAGDARAVQVTA
jgi:hypothetical protein